MNLSDNTLLFFLNLSFIFILYFVYYSYIEGEIKNNYNHKFFIGLLSAVAIILCMTFSTSPFPDFIFDMRQVPFIIGALYGGRRVALSLLIVLLSYRYFIGFDTGFYMTVVHNTSLFLFMLYSIPRFRKSNNTKERIKIAILTLILTHGLLIILLYAIGININLVTFYFFSLYGAQAVGIILFVNFIERAKKDQLILSEVNKLEKLRVVSDIAASISHEVRNPLTVTKGFLQLLREPDKLSDQKHKMYVNMALEELERAEVTISDYLTFAKPSLENTDLLDLSKEMDYIRKVISPYATMNNVEVIFEVEDSPFIIGERQKLHQCLINISKNAIEAMPERGILTFGLQQCEDRAVVTIKDTGCGMDEEQVKRLGTPYYSTKDKGTGLGTMVVFSIVNIMGGHVTVDSKVGKGTCFTLSFPLKNSTV